MTVGPVSNEEHNSPTWDLSKAREHYMAPQKRGKHFDINKRGPPLEHLVPASRLIQGSPLPHGPDNRPVSVLRERYSAVFQGKTMSNIRPESAAGTTRPVCTSRAASLLKRPQSAQPRSQISKPDEIKCRRLPGYTGHMPRRHDWIGKPQRVWDANDAPKKSIFLPSWKKAGYLPW
eukprot:CAMPEP_0174306102 /NCGR_PEP_ID=MMETSP0810-20121108/230_1 /TAXON_ID=73025 ORGANISM="Eutreptiella gymnastica-like, Strain CCMP1594" /NCGR_SAMPLE_ID=MMETSP0810 /ASSEMBLY_ACC=CAM_ASM_000659 /LENGTH=175 /DNA_ID=CAMNT_0015412711 /DNA_START=40 /DNA_END=567 /DNA_ORIENTATION=-